MNNREASIIGTGTSEEELRTVANDTANFTWNQIYVDIEACSASGDSNVVSPPIEGASVGVSFISKSTRGTNAIPGEHVSGAVTEHNAHGKIYSYF